jgi:quinol monooxygenase YgiN
LDARKERKQNKPATAALRAPRAAAPARRTKKKKKKTKPPPMPPHSSSALSWRHAALAAAALATAASAAAYWLGVAHGGGLGPTRPQQRRAFVLAVRLRFRSVSERDAWIAVWRPLAEAVKRDEPRTLSFELSVSDRDERHIMVFERYASKSDYVGLHRGTSAFAEFKRRSAALPFFEAIAVEGESYVESGIGFPL